MNTELPNSKPLPLTAMLFCHLIGAESSISRTMSGQIRMPTVCILGWFCHNQLIDQEQVICGRLFLYLLNVKAGYKTFDVLSFYIFNIHLPCVVMGRHQTKVKNVKMCFSFEFKERRLMLFIAILPHRRNMCILLFYFIAKKNK